jgi:hypothetical protein
MRGDDGPIGGAGTYALGCWIASGWQIDKQPDSSTVSRMALGGPGEAAGAFLRM